MSNGVEPDSEGGFLHMNRLEGHLQQKIIYCGPLLISGVYQPPNRMIVYRTLMLCTRPILRYVVLIMSFMSLKIHNVLAGHYTIK